MSKTAVRIAAGAIIVLTWTLVGVSLREGGGPRVDAAPFEASGKLMAQKALGLLDSGGQITVIARDTSTFSNPASDIQLASFLKEIAQAHAAVSTIRKLQVDPLRPIAVPSSDFCELIQNAGPGSVIVSLMGPPRLMDSERARLGAVQPAIIAFCSGNLPEVGEMRTLFQHGLLRAAVLDRRGSDDSAFAAANLSDRPEKLFLTLTAASFPDLAAKRQ